MRWPFFLAVPTLLGACGASEVQSQRLKDGSWNFTCELSMDECVRRVQTSCPQQRFRILEGTSETRLRDAPPFERAYHTSRLHLICTNDGANVLLSVGSESTAKSQAPGASTTACSIGETRTCVGAGACQGGQACLPDRSGFSACDCGTVEKPSSAPPGAAPSAAAPPTAPSGMGSSSSSAPVATPPSAPSP